MSYVTMPRCLSTDSLPSADEHPSSALATKPAAGQGWLARVWRDMRSHWWIGVLSVAYVVTGLLQNVGVQQMGYYMPIYSTFLLYGTTALYTMMFAFMSVLAGEWTAKNRALIKHEWPIIVALGFFTAFNGIFAQIAIPFVSPELTSLVTQISTPVTWIATPFLLNDPMSRPTPIRCGAFAVILFGLLFGGIYSLGHGSGSSGTYKNGWWIGIALLSALPTSFETIYQQKAYKEKGLPIYLTLTLYNLISFIPYSLWMLTTMTKPFGTCVTGSPHYTLCADDTHACTFSEMLDQQVQAVQCFVGLYHKSQCCASAMSTVWVVVFTVFYFASFNVGAYLLKESDGSNLVANLNALTAPFVGIFFWIPMISGPSYSHFEWWILFSFGIILLGNVLYDNLGRLDRPWNPAFGPNRAPQLPAGYEPINDRVERKLSV